jgi:hypothetical protein
MNDLSTGLHTPVALSDMETGLKKTDKVVSPAVGPASLAG